MRPRRVEQTTTPLSAAISRSDTAVQDGLHQAGARTLAVAGEEPIGDEAEQLRAGLLVEGLGVESLGFKDLLHKAVCPRHLDSSTATCRYVPRRLTSRSTCPLMPSTSALPSTCQMLQSPPGRRNRCRTQSCRPYLPPSEYRS